MTESDFRQLLDALADAVVAADADGRVVYANRAAESLLGWPAGTLVGEPWSLIVPDETADSGRGRAIGHDGAGIEVEVTRSSARLDDGSTLGVATLRRPGRPQPGASRYLQATARAAVALGARRDIEGVLAVVSEVLVGDFDAVLARVWLLDRTAETLVLHASAGPAGTVGAEATPHGIVADVARTLQPVIRTGLGPDTQLDAEWVARERIASLGAFPLVSAGELRGVLAHYSRDPLPGEAVDALLAFGAVVASSLNDVQHRASEAEARVEADDHRRKLQSILDTIPVGVLLAEGPEGRLTVVNPAANAIAGEPVSAESLAEFIARFPLEHLDGRTYQTSERPLWRALQGEPRVHELLRYRRRDGRDLVLDVTTAPFPGPRGGAVTTFTDVTERLRLETELGDRAAQFKALLDHLPVGVAYFDILGACRACNGPAKRYLARSRREIIGSSAAELFAQSESLRDRLLSCVRDQARHVEHRVPWPDPAHAGKTRYLDWRFEPLPSDPHKPRGALALIVDVTDRAHAEAELQRAAAVAEQASRNKTQFLSAVSHDLRTPVNALTLQAELLARIVADRDDPGGDLRLLTGDIRHAAANLIELINDLLDLTRFDSGQVEHHPTTFTLDDWLASTLAPLELMARAKGLDFSWEADHPGRILRADRVKLGRVLINLAGNAVKFTESGAVRVHAGATPDGRFALVVDDTGPGIPDDQRERIFDEFAQLRNPERDRTKGTGLGLAICRRLVQSVGGQLAVEGRPGGGSRFTAFYPPDYLAEASAPHPGPDNHPAPAPAAGEDGVILLVEDDAYSRTALARLLSRDGYTVEAAADGPSALAAAERVRPALVLLDLMMPGMDGVEVLNRLRARPDGRSLPVVVLTGDLMGGRTGELRALQVDGVLAKPVDFEELRSEVARHVARRPAGDPPPVAAEPSRGPGVP